MIEESANVASTEGPPLSKIFHLMPDPFSETVVERALKFRGKASDGLRREFNSAIGASVRVNGFRNASKATHKQLAGPVLEYLDRAGDSRLTRAVLRTWEESQSSLRSLVAEHLSAAGQRVAGPDYESCRFNGIWDQDDWIRERKVLVEGSKDGLDEDDVALMLCLVSGRIPAPDHLDDELPPIESGRFRRWIDELDDLPPRASDWEDAEAFAKAVEHLAVRKQKEFIIERFTSFNEDLDSCKEKFADELQYLDLELGAWFDAAFERLDILPEAQDLVDELKGQLSAYRPIRPQAAVLNEERRRSKARERCEEAILRIADQWDKLMSAPREAPALKVAESQGNYATGKASGRAAAAAEQSEERLDALRSELEQLKRDHESLQAKNAGMQSDKELLDKENSELKRLLGQSEATGEHWRQAYVLEKGKSKREDEAQAPGELASVSDAIARARETFPDELVIALNSKSRKNNCPFQKPDEVFDALAWLATEFRRMRLNPGANPDFNKSIKEACSGWFYKANQTEVTMSQFVDWYRTSVGGQTHDLSSHIGKGTSFDPKSTIRIAFAWDEENQRVILGFIGLHQKNRSS